MNSVTVARACKSFGSVEVLCGINLHVPSGAVLALLGPSGCGKTTLLRLIAGFDPIDDGHIAFNDRIVASSSHFVPPERRGIGYVPQEGTLFPHLTVEGNIRYGLPRGSNQRGRIDDVLALTGMQGLGARYPHELSGGQQQRVALARALAPGPTLVLLDEPFNALDLDLRRSICEEVVDVLRRTGTTAILVTHDPGEAFAVSDELAVMQAGEIMQCARPEQVYWQPADPAVARLTGPAIFLPGTLRGREAHCALGQLALHDSVTASGSQVSVMVRPEQVHWAPAGTGVAAQVTQRSFRGDHTMIRLQLDAVHLDLRMPSLAAPALHARGSVRIEGACMAYAPEADAYRAASADSAVLAAG